MLSIKFLIRDVRPFKQVRAFVSIGDKVAINFMKGKLSMYTLLMYYDLMYMYIQNWYGLDGKDPVIKDDKEYPDWVHGLHLKVL